MVVVVSNAPKVYSYQNLSPLVSRAWSQVQCWRYRIGRSAHSCEDEASPPVYFANGSTRSSSRCLLGSFLRMILSTGPKSL
jgi:hypothetical protein